MELNILLTLITAATMAGVLVPLLRRLPPAPDRAELDRKVYRRQLRELDRDATFGLADGESATLVRLEIERRLLAVADSASSRAVRPWQAKAVAVALSSLLPVVAAGLYLRLGSPALPDQPFAARAVERNLIAESREGLVNAVESLEAKIAAEGGKATLDEWLLLGRSRAALGQYQASSDAFRQAMELGPDRPDIVAGYAETLVAASDGSVVPAAHKLFAQVLERDPKNAVARLYLALADAQAGRVQAAIDGWKAILPDLPPGSPLRDRIRSLMAVSAKEAGLPAPQTSDAAAPASDPASPEAATILAAAPAEREQMIQGMVAALAAKLQDHPDDLDGWLKLGRAYKVLNQPAEAADAYRHAAALRPDDATLMLLAAEALLSENPRDAPISDDIVTLLRRADALDPKQPLALWQLGMASVQRGHAEEAQAYWRRLLAMLPPGGAQHQTVSEALKAITRADGP